MAQRTGRGHSRADQGLRAPIRRFATTGAVAAGVVGLLIAMFVLSYRGGWSATELLRIAAIPVCAALAGALAGALVGALVAPAERRPS